MSESTTQQGKVSNSALLFMILAPVAVVNYLVFILNPHNADDTTMYVLQLIADLFSIAAVSGLWITMILDILTPSYQIKNRADRGKFLIATKPSIDVFIPVANEPIELIETTIRAAVAMKYPHGTIVLDDGRSDEVRRLAQKLGVVYVRRAHNRHAKSGNLNNGLRHSAADFFAVLDADFVADPNFIIELLSYMEDPAMAFIQSPQHYTNMDNFVALGTAGAQEVFYKYVMPAKNSSDSSFCVGTNVIFRREAINQIGGIFELDHSEDIWTSISLHERGWKSLFVNQVLATGLAPDNVVSYFKQQRRWAQGGFSIFFRNNPLFSQRLSPDQRIQYLYSSTFYFIGFSILMYLSLPIIYLLFGLSPIRVDNSFQWVIHYVPYIVIFYTLPLFLIGKVRLATISTSLASFYPFIQAFFSTVFERKQEWVTTASRRRGGQQFPLEFIWPHLLLIGLSFAAITLGWFYAVDIANTMINSIWAAINALLLIVFLARGFAPLTNK